jgi:hypothetical protein
VARMRLVAAAAAVACVFAASAAGGDYKNTAQALMPTPPQVKFAQVVEFKKAKRPAAKLARGWKSGVAAIFQKGTSKTAVDAAITAFIYTSAANATTAWTNACPKCAHMKVSGIQIRYVAGKTSAGIDIVQLFGACRNVYTTVVTEGSETQTKLVGDAELIVFGIYKRANHFGMSACK